ncbi:DUF6585 family protein [Actinomadura sp. SCN-SB]|uniref:DUF6585 family protein n=1 Tax=Actinomadura sp. SCN-SB TaxID=3373092 RepID=UPI003753A17D
MSFPPSILERAVERKLGEPVRAFDGRASLWRALTWTGLFGLAGLVLVPTAVTAMVVGRAGVGSVAVLGVAAQAVAVPWLARKGLILAGPADLRARNKTVYLFACGLILRAGGERPAYRWEDLASVTVSGVRDGAQGPTRYRFAVSAADGREIVFGPELPGVRALGERVAAEVTGRVLPDRLARVRAGESVRMGPFTLGPDGVEKEGERLSWADVVKVGVDNGVVYVGTRDEAHRLSAIASRMPNAIAFVQVCRTLADDEGAVSRN